MIETFEAKIGQKVGNAVGSGLELAIGDDGSRAGHDECRLVGPINHVLSRIHCPPPVHSRAYAMVSPC